MTSPTGLHLPPATVLMHVVQTFEDLTATGFED